jgi:hypothetical protein
MSRLGIVRIPSITATVASRTRMCRDMNSFESHLRRSKSSWLSQGTMFTTENHVAPLVSVGRVAPGVSQCAAFLGVRHRRCMGLAIASGSVTMHG